MFKKCLFLILFYIFNTITLSSTETINYFFNIEGEPTKESSCIIKTSSNSKDIICESSQNKETFKLIDNKLTEWENYFTDKTFFKAKLFNDNIILTGKNKDKPIEKKNKLTNTQWIQSPSLLLSDFIVSQQKNIEFIMVTGPMFSKMVIKKDNIETITINKTPYKSQKVIMSPPGLLGKLWKASIWFDLVEGNMIRYKAPSGPPGSKKLIMELKNN